MRTMPWPRSVLAATFSAATGWNTGDLAFTVGAGGFSFTYPDAFRDERALVRLRGAWRLNHDRR